MLSAPYLKGRRSEMIHETLILLTIYALMPCMNQLESNSEAKDNLGYFMIDFVASSLVQTLSQIVWIVVTDSRSICMDGKVDQRKNSIAQQRLALRQKRATEERLRKLR